MVQREAELHKYLSKTEEQARANEVNTKIEASLTDLLHRIEDPQSSYIDDPYTSRLLSSPTSGSRGGLTTSDRNIINIDSVPSDKQDY